jgi:hypothetical protein
MSLGGDQLRDRARGGRRGRATKYPAIGVLGVDEDQ